MLPYELSYINICFCPRRWWIDKRELLFWSSLIAVDICGRWRLRWGWRFAFHPTLFERKFGGFPLDFTWDIPILIYINLGTICSYSLCGIHHGEEYKTWMDLMSPGQKWGIFKRGVKILPFSRRKKEYTKYHNQDKDIEGIDYFTGKKDKSKAFDAYQILHVHICKLKFPLWVIAIHIWRCGAFLCNKNSRNQ